MNTSLPEAFVNEREALEAVAKAAHAQLRALSTGPPEAFEDAVAETLTHVAELERCQERRRRLVADPTAPAVSLEARAALERAVHAARDACDTLAFALEHAVSLGRDLLRMGHEPPPEAHVYTARGALSAVPAGRVHRTG